MNEQFQVLKLLNSKVLNALDRYIRKPFCGSILTRFDAACQQNASHIAHLIKLCL